MTETVQQIFAHSGRKEQSERAAIVVSSASPGCGKSTLLDLVQSKAKIIEALCRARESFLEDTANKLAARPFVRIATTFNSYSNIEHWQKKYVIQGSLRLVALCVRLGRFDWLLCVCVWVAVDNVLDV